MLKVLVFPIYYCMLTEHPVSLTESFLLKLLTSANTTSALSFSKIMRVEQTSCLFPTHISVFPRFSAGGRECVLQYMPRKSI